MVSFTSNGDTCDGYLAVPASGSGPGVIVVQEWWGLVDHITDVADRLAGEGYVALAPDFFHGARTDEPSEAQRMLMGLAMDRAAREIQGAARYLVGRDETTRHAVGVVGFCMGGSLALWAGALADEVQVAVGFYPAIPWERMSPTWGRYEGKAAVIHASEHDGGSSAPGIRAAVQGISEAGGVVEVYDYPGSQHAFFNDRRPEVYDAQHSAAAWQRTLGAFSSRL
jgi:carboxymethylenebutenolidase